MHQVLCAVQPPLIVVIKLVAVGLATDDPESFVGCNTMDAAGWGMVLLTIKVRTSECAKSRHLFVVSYHIFGAWTCTN